MVEYAVILGVVSVISVPGISVIGQRINGNFSSVAAVFDMGSNNVATNTDSNDNTATTSDKNGNHSGGKSNNGNHNAYGHR